MPDLVLVPLVLTALAGLVVVAAVNSVASLFYYLRWIGPAFDRSGAPAADGTARPVAALSAGTAAVASVGVGLAAGAVLAPLA